MIKKFIICIVIIAILGVVVYMIYFRNIINTDFATSAIIRLPDNNLIVITDEDEIRELQGILRGRAVADSPASGFSINVSITMASEDQEIVFLPALTGSSIVRIHNLDKYIVITDQQREFIDMLFERNGLRFPYI